LAINQIDSRYWRAHFWNAIIIGEDEEMLTSPERQPVVLIAEGNDDDLLLLRMAFKEFGYDGATQYVQDGEEAVAYLAGEGRFQKRSEFPLPDFLLLDLKMPRMSGLEVLAWIRAQPTLAQLRTVVFTTSDDLRDIRKAYEFGASSFLRKSVNFSEFKDTVQALFTYWLTLNKAAPAYRLAPRRRLPG
jgi:CheY-like chemotaxis protein